SRRRHTRFSRDWSSDVCSSDLALEAARGGACGEPRTVSKAKKDVEKATGQNAGRPDRAGRQGLGDHPSGTRDLLLDAREGARPGLARPHLLGKSVDGVLGGLLVGEAAGGDHEQRLALMDL